MAVEKVLAGIPRLSFARGEAYTPAGVLRGVAEYLGQDVSYAWLMGISGAAFRLAWSPDWSLDMVNVVPRDVVAQGASWLSLRAEHHLNEDPGVTWGRIKESIEEGMPVLSCGLAGAPEYCIIAGYREEPRRLQVLSYFRLEDGYAEVAFRPWQGWNFLGFGLTPLVLLRRVPEPDRGALVKASLEGALELGGYGGGGRQEGGKTTGPAKHFFGLAAYEAWHQSLSREEEFKARIGPKAFANALNLQALADARRAAGEYLQVVAALRPEWARGLRRAAEHYRHEVAVLAEARRLMPYPVELQERAEEVAEELLGDGERRRRFSDYIRTARAEEAEALDWISMTLRGEV